MRPSAPVPGGTRWRYRLHGLDLDSDTPLPGLKPCAATTVAELRLIASGPRDQDAAEEDEPSDIELRRDADGWDLLWPGGPRLRLDAAATRVELVRRAPGDLWCALGPGVALALRLRGRLALHASAVAGGGEAIAFAGPSGSGKSTLALQLADRAGCAFLADDSLAVDRHEGVWRARAAAPVAAVDRRTLALLPSAKIVGERDGKAILATSNGVPATGAPLREIWLTHVTSGTEIEAGPALRGLEAVTRLLPQLYAAHYLPEDVRGSELDDLCDLATRVTVRAVGLPGDPRRAAEQAAARLGL